MTTQEDLLAFVNKRIKDLIKIRDEMHAEGNHVADEYTEGAIDSYNIMRIKLEGKVEFINDDEDDEAI